MSGIEIAGLVLGVFPVVVSGLKAYAEGIDTVKTWRRYRRELDGYKRQLETQRIWYLDTLEELLGFVGSEEELAELVREPGGSLWQRPEYATKLRERLDHSYDPYLAIIRELLQTLQIVQRKLCIDASGKVSWEDGSSLKRQLERLKVVLSKSTYSELMRKIERANTDLRELTHQSRYLEPVRKQRRRPRQKAPDFRSIRRSAISLHKMLIKKGDSHWKCPCRARHVVNIRLEPRGSHADARNGQSLRFRLLLSLLATHDGAQKLVKSHYWQELEVAPTMLARKVNIPQNGNSVDYSSGHSNHVKLYGPASDDNPTPSSPTFSRKKMIRFALDDRDNSSLKSVSTISSSGSTLGNSSVLSPPPSPLQPPQIADLCASLHSVKASHEGLLGFLLDNNDSNGSHRHELFVGEVLEYQPPDPKTESLRDLLCAKSSHSFQSRQLSRRDRLYLAAVLASSVLQMDGSWLKRYWSSGDIRFLLNKDTSKPIVEKPYVSWTPESEPAHAVDLDAELAAITLNTGPGTTTAESDGIKPDGPNPKTSEPVSPDLLRPPFHSHPSHLIRAEPLFPLGLTLVELSLGAPLPALYSPEDADPNPDHQSLKTALRLLNAVYDESGTRYGDAAMKCLYWNEVRDARMENEEFQQAVFETVVGPLFDDLRDFDGGSRIR